MPRHALVSAVLRASRADDFESASQEWNAVAQLHGAYCACGQFFEAGFLIRNLATGLELNVGPKCGTHLGNATVNMQMETLGCVHCRKCDRLSPRGDILVECDDVVEYFCKRCCKRERLRHAALQRNAAHVPVQLSAFRDLVVLRKLQGAGDAFRQETQFLRDLQKLLQHAKEKNNGFGQARILKDAFPGIRGFLARRRGE